MGRITIFNEGNCNSSQGSFIKLFNTSLFLNSFSVFAVFFLSFRFSNCNCKSLLNNNKINKIIYNNGTKKKIHIIITYKSQNILTNFFLIKFSPKILIKGNL